MENTLFIGDFPTETTISGGFSIATFDYQRVRFMNHSYLIGGFNSSEKYEFVNWDDDNPN